MQNLVNCLVFSELAEQTQPNLFFVKSWHIRGRYYGLTILEKDSDKKKSLKIIENTAFKNRPNVGFSAKGLWLLRAFRTTVNM